MARTKTSNGPSQQSTPPQAATRASEAPKAKRSKPPAARASDERVDAWPSDEAIAARAYELYVQSGYQDGHAEEHWFQAERELRHMN